MDKKETKNFILRVSRCGACLLLILQNFIRNLRMCLRFRDSLIRAELDITVSLHAGSGRNQLADDNVLLRSDQRIDLSADRGIRQNPCRLLERSCRQERIRRKGRLCNTEDDALALCRCFAEINELITMTSICLSAISTPCRR